MADTGAPWNIPYVEPADLVRNYPAAAEDLADAIAAGLTAAGNPGIGSNVVQFLTSTSTATTSSSFVNTLMTATITPSSNTAKVLLIASYTAENAGGGNNTVTTLFRGDVTGTNLMGDGTQQVGVSASTNRSTNALVFLDSPATSSAVTYTVGLRSIGGATATLMNSQTLTLIEVAA